MTELGLMRIFAPTLAPPTTTPTTSPLPLRIVDRNGDPLDELCAPGLEAYAEFEIVALYPLEIGVLDRTDHTELAALAEKHSMSLCPTDICDALRAQYNKCPITMDSDLFIDFEDRIFFLRKK